MIQSPPCRTPQDQTSSRSREWHANGQLAEDGEYEYGIVLWEKQWDENGILTKDYALKEDDQDYRTLLRYRARHGSSGTGVDRE
jgi:antitoxin component YwqK of YwqJK toxin-antitoxin module